MNIIALREPYIWSNIEHLLPIWFVRIEECYEDVQFRREMEEEWMRWVTPKRVWE